MVGIKERGTKQVRAEVVDNTTKETLQGFIDTHADPDTKKFTDENTSYAGLPNRESVKHSVGQWVEGQAHTNSMESFWSMLKRGYHGAFYQMSYKYLHCYVAEFAGHHNIRDKDTLEQMSLLSVGLVGKRLRYQDLIDS